MIDPRIHRVFVFANGAVVVTTAKGELLREYMGNYNDVVAKIREHYIGPMTKIGWKGAPNNAN